MKTGKTTLYPNSQNHIQILFGSACLNFKFSASVIAPHWHWNSLHALITGIGFVGRLQWRCEKTDTGRFDQ